MTMLAVEVDADEGDFDSRDRVFKGYVEDEDTTARIGDEEGMVHAGIARWLNSARVTVSPENDEVTCVVSVGDPRGGFVFTVRRNSDGEILLHTPHPGEGLPHMRLKELHPGTYIVVGDRGDEPLTFEDEEETNRDPRWRDGWDEMIDGTSEPDDRDAPYGIDFHGGVWRVVERQGGKLAKEDDVTDFESAEDAAERAEELNEEAIEED